MSNLRLSTKRSEATLERCLVIIVVRFCSIRMYPVRNQSFQLYLCSIQWRKTSVKKTELFFCCFIYLFKSGYSICFRFIRFGDFSRLAFILCVIIWQLKFNFSLFKELILTFRQRNEMTNHDRGIVVTRAVSMGFK